MKYNLRPLKAEDGKKVLAIFEEGIAGGNATYDRDAPSWEVWNNKFFESCRTVAEDEDGTVVGWAAIQPFSRRACFSGVAEVSIYISAVAQGQGLGFRLLDRLVQESEEHGFWTLQAGIFPENKASIALHEKLGFRVIGVREKLGQMSGIWRDVVLMERRSQTVGL